MNKDYLPRFIEIACKAHGNVYKTTETEAVINYSWEIPVKYYNPETKVNPSFDSDQVLALVILQRVQEYTKTNGWKITYAGWKGLVKYPDRVSREFFSITYDKSRDKISLSRFTFGYGYKPDSRVQGTPGNLTGRIYPFKRNVPLLCLTDRVWAFAQIKGKKRYQYKPRVYTGRLWQPELTEYLRKVLDCSEDVLRLNVSYKYFKGYRYEAQVMHKRYPGIINVLITNESQNPTKDKGWDYNWLINISDNQPRELLKMVAWRASEDLIPKPEDKYNVWWSSADFLLGRPVQDRSDLLPF